MRPIKFIRGIYSRIRSQGNSETRGPLFHQAVPATSSLPTLVSISVPKSIVPRHPRILPIGGAEHFSREGPRLFRPVPGPHQDALLDPCVPAAFQVAQLVP